ncbi:Netrin-1 Precursor [Channa argus]|uniref:Netrin-1 n=1 Tax=Channa argus TaxID=215402 RepID=A0A6G1Q6V3_CHAAH|nr:Netrin-1 Precursor [Channa argus]
MGMLKFVRQTKSSSSAHQIYIFSFRPRQAHGLQNVNRMKKVNRLDDMMFLPFSPPPSTSLFPVVLLLLFLPPSLISSSLSHTPLSWTSPHDPCYQLDGRPRHCMSEFINAAYGVPVHASHSLQGPDYDTNITTLTDLHNPHNLTCWRANRGPDSGDWVLTLPLGRRFEITYISLQFCHQGEPSDPISISIFKSMDYGRTWRPMQHYASDCLGNFGLPSHTVAQTRHQETEPLCSDPRPLQKQRGGMVLAFSTLDGRPSSPDFDYSPTLQDWVTATDIRVVFHRLSKDIKVVNFDRRQEAQRHDGADNVRGTGLLRWRSGGQVDKLNTDDTLVFFDRETKNSEIRTRNKGEKMNKNDRKGHYKGSGQDENGHNVTSKEGGDSVQTDMLASSKKGGKSRGRGRKKENHWLPCPNRGCNWTVERRSRSSKGRELRKRRNNNLNSKQSAKNLQVAPPSAFKAPLALSDLQVGGRCKCNGHASRCRRDDTGRAVCVCEHHTSGPDCDVCEDFYFDRPWHRATPTHPNPCVACECNGHSNKCRFSMEVFQQSGRRSGGVCQKCRHHTAGRHCQYCQNGYTRDHSKPLNHRKACQPCQCHPLGAVGRWCNQTSGQCLCREGVTGLRCNRCAPGYKQGKSPLRPCIRIQEAAPTPVYQPQYSIAEECVSYCQPSQVKVRMNLETYCLKDYVLKVQVKGMERSGPWWQFSISVQTVFRARSTSRVRRGPLSLWVPDRDLSCGCPALHVGRTFLLIGAEEGEREWGPEESRLVADRSTLALQWREHWNVKLRAFRGQDKRGRCPAKSPSHHHHQHHHREHTKSQSGYIPPHLLPEKDTDTQSVKGVDAQTTAVSHTDGKTGENSHMRVVVIALTDYEGNGFLAQTAPAALLQEAPVSSCLPGTASFDMKSGQEIYEAEANRVIPTQPLCFNVVGLVLDVVMVSTHRLQSPSSGRARLGVQD